MTFPLHPLLVRLACVAALLGCSSAWAQAPAAPAGDPPAKQNAPAQEEPDTVILSDTLKYNDAKKESIFTGTVIMTRGLMTLRADKLVLHEDAQGDQFGTATVEPGKLVEVRQENPEKFEVVEAKGLRGEYNGKDDTIEMIGQAVVTRFICGKPFDTVRGERVKYFQESDVYQAVGGPNSSADNGRVRSVTKPRAKAEQAAEECRKGRK